MPFPQNRMFRLPEVSMLSRPSLNAFTEDFVHLEAQLSCVLFGVSKKKQIVSSDCLEETDKLVEETDKLVDLGKKTRSTCRFKDVCVRTP